jgi:hypothetical protein
LVSIEWLVVIGCLGLGVIVLVVAVYFVIRSWAELTRGARVLWFIKGRVTAAFLTVYVLGGAPIAAHLFAVQANEQESKTTAQFGPVLIADVYLFGFIIALAGVVDALSLGQASTAMVFVALALISGFGNYNGMLDIVVRHPIGTWLAIPVWTILGVCAGGYAWFKGLRLYAAGAEDWEKAERERAGRRGQSKL